MKSVLGLLLYMLPLLSAAAVVVPIDSVEDHVNIRLFPDAKSERVGRLQQGDSARLVRSLPDWHEIAIAGGATGFISADWTNVLDKAPAPVVEVEPVAVATEEPPVLAAAKPAAEPEAEQKVQAVPATETIVQSVPEADEPADDQIAAGNDVEKNIVELTLEEALAALANVAPVTLNYKQDREEQYVGFIAEDVPEIMANSDRTGLSAMDIVAALTRVVQLQQQQIADLESRLATRE